MISVSLRLLTVHTGTTEGDIGAAVDPYSTGNFYVTLHPCRVPRQIKATAPAEGGSILYYFDILE